MPRYSDELIEEVRSRNDIVDVIGKYVKLTKKGSTYFGLCPFHNEKTPSFSVTPSKQMYYCFGCGAGGNVFTFLMNYENFTFTEAMEELAGRVGIELPKQEYSAEQKREADRRQLIFDANREAGKFYYMMLRSERGKSAHDYFTNRKLSEETMKKFGLGYSDMYSDSLYKYLKSKGFKDDILKDTGLFTYDEVKGAHDKFWNRAMFPIMDVHSKIIGFGGRVMGEGEPKYLNSAETKIFDKGRNLYGLNIARSSKREGFLLCEGYMDVISLHQAGFDNAVASLGTALTSGHANLLKRYTKEVYLTYDSDGAGVKAALRAIPILKQVGITAKVIDMRPHKDPDEFIKALGAEAYQERIDNAENSFMYEIRMLERNFDLKDPEDKTKFYHAIAEKLLGFPEELERSNYLEAVADKYRIGFDALRKLVNTLAAKGVRQTSQSENEPERRVREKKKNDGMKESEKLLLTYLIEDTGLFDQIKGYIDVSDFSEGIYYETAKILFEQYETSGTVNPAQIISRFEDEDDQRELASLFNAKIRYLSTDAEQQKALKETVIRVKQNSLNNRSANLDPTDMNGLQKLVEDKRKLSEMNRLVFTIKKPQE
ncbi:MAG: DNA primase [Lachnospiraceae bacterium]|nr:DNA primase [Lachnospiraceae bacterium]